MLRKILRWLSFLTVFVVLILLGAGYGLRQYLAGNEEKLLQDYLETKGMSVAFRGVDFRWWEEFPLVTITVDSLVLRDTLTGADAPALAHIGYLRSTLDFGRVLEDTIGLKTLVLRDAVLQLVADSSGRTNAGRLFPTVDTVDTVEAPEKLDDPWLYDLSEFHVDLANVDVHYVIPPKHKRIEGCVNEVLTLGRRARDGGFRFDGVMDFDVLGLGFNTRKGAYLRNSRVRGPLNLRVDADLVRFDSTTLNINGDHYQFVGDIQRGGPDSTRLYFANDSADYEHVVSLLHDELREKLKPYAVYGPFAATGVIKLPPKPARDASYEIDFACEDAGITIKQYDYTQAYVRAHVTSDLPVELGGIPHNPKDLLFRVDHAHANWGGVYFSMDDARVPLIENDPYFHGHVRLWGTGPAMARKLQNDQFFFRGGNFVSEIHVDGANLMSTTDFVRRTDLDLSIHDVTVDYPAGGVRVPFEDIKLRKNGPDVTFALHGAPLPGSGVTVDLTGKLNKLEPLLLTGHSDSLTSTVQAYAPRLNWTDLTTLLGDPTRSGSAGGAQSADRVSTTATKATLLSLRDNFGPSVDLRVDTLGYYDLFTLHDFRTGVHFERDTLVLEQTRFRWREGGVEFAARLDVSRPEQTPFALGVRTEELDLNALRPTLEHFGFALPAGVDSLPERLNVDLAHRGRILDSVGLLPGFNAGELFFDDGRECLFDGRLTYAPDTGGRLRTKLSLTGDPHIVNVLTGAENFLFGSGRFGLDLRLPDVPETLSELLAVADLRLNVADSRVIYPAAGLSVPVSRFDVSVREENADFTIRLSTAPGGSPLKANGRLEPLGAFLIEGDERTFKVRSDVTAGSLRWSEIAGLALREGERGTTDSLDVQTVLSATGGIFESFRPDISLRIDSFFLGDRLPFTDIHAGLVVDTNDVLTLERSGFTFGDGRAEVVGTYPLDTAKRSPFRLDWTVENMTVDRLLREFNDADLFDPDSSGYFGGNLNLSGSTEGYFDEEDNNILPASLSGTIAYELTDAVLLNNPALAKIGRKALMRARMQRVLMPPLKDTLHLIDGVLTVPRTEIATTGFQLFIEGSYDLLRGPDLLVSIPLRNVGYGRLLTPPLPRGYDGSGWMVHFVLSPPEEAGGPMQQKFRFGRKRWDRRRAVLETSRHR